MKRNVLIFIFAAAIVGLVAAIFPHLPSKAGAVLTKNLRFLVPRESNCGGNSAALAVCGELASQLLVSKPGERDQFNVFNISESNKLELVRAANYHWVTGAQFFIRTNIDLNISPKQLIIVCGKVYDNVPQPTIWNLHHKTPAHAVGYSDLTTGLISPEEFKKLDLREFIDAAQLATNSSQKASL